MQDKKANFEKIATNRKGQIIDKIFSLTKLKNTSFYTFSEEDIKEMFNDIEEATSQAKKVLLTTAKQIKRREERKLKK